MSLCMAGMLFAAATKTTVEKICEKPGNFNGFYVEVKGRADIYVAGPQDSTRYYVLKGEFGGVIKVKTTLQYPDQGEDYDITGVVGVDSYDQTPYIIEQSRAGGGGGGGGVVKRGFLEKHGKTILIGAIVILFGLVIYLLTLKKGGAEDGDFDDDWDVGGSTGKGGTWSGGSGGGGAAPPMPSPTADMKTVKIQASPKTMKFIPGTLTVLSGEDQGKSFRIAGYPTPDGSEVTIGRESVSGERAYAHIQLNDPKQTVSRKQACIIEKGGKIRIQNLSSVNLTKVDGRELQPNESAELKNGSVIQMGFMELKYTV